MSKPIDLMGIPLKNPVVTAAGPWARDGKSIQRCIDAGAGAVITETVFAWPGLGRLMFDALMQRDYQLLLGVFLLDRAGYAGVATSLVTAALISSWVGVGQTVPKLDDTPGSMLVVATGLVIGVVGTRGSRRATAWIGALITGIGTVSFMYSLMQPFDSVSDAGGMLLFSGALLVGGAVLAATIIRSRHAAAGAAANAPLESVTVAPNGNHFGPPQG